MNIQEFKENPHLREFEIEDDFNDNLLKGFLCRQQGNIYGTILITHVNGDETEQLIYGVPKINYPFDRAGTFRYPEFDSCSWFSKLDGTCILAYCYTHNGKSFVTYKTRLTPVVKDMKFGNFKKMWDEILDRYPQIPLLVSPDRSLSFELYGALNKHLILYPLRLDTALLFGIHQPTGDILPPDSFTHGLPIPEIYSTEGKDFEEAYNNLRIKLEEENRWEGEDLIGTEGSVVYLDTREGYVLFKVKPPTIQEIHMKPGLSRRDIIVTCKNALESSDDLTYDVVKELLLEEITEFEIEQRAEVIHSCIRAVLTEQKLINEIVGLYEKAKEETRETIISDKASIMRWLSSHFEKDQMRTVYTYVIALEN